MKKITISCLFLMIVCCSYAKKALDCFIFNTYVDRLFYRQENDHFHSYILIDQKGILNNCYSDYILIDNKKVQVSKSLKETYSDSIGVFIVTKKSIGKIEIFEFINTKTNQLASYSFFKQTRRNRTEYLGATYKQF